MIFYLPIILMVLGTTVYHIAQTSVPTQVNPLFSLTMNYISALLGTIARVPFYPSRTAGKWSIQSVN